ncbi:MAG TPA: efflux RND transporter periplasmic adaptor subunit [Nitrospirales bacterium]|nr:efflux RND transporter periplasmic adaptor subunit [Nitrospirales bacterium]
MMTILARVKKRGIWVVVLLGVAVGLLFLLRLQTQETSERPASTQPTQETIVRGVSVEATLQDIPQTIESTGVVIAETRANLSSKTIGIVEALHVDEGSVVNKGKVLIQLDHRALNARLARTDAEVSNAHANLQRMDDLFNEDSISPQDLDNARRGYQVAVATRDEVRAQLADTRVLAPFAGIITRKHIEAGELAAPGQPLLELENQTRLRIDVSVAEGDVQAVTVGHSIEIIFDSLALKVIEGKVFQIVPSADPATHTFLVKIRLAADDTIKPGMFGRVMFKKQPRLAILIPLSATVSRGELTGVYIVNANHRLGLRWVKLGRQANSMVEVLSGVNENEHLLADATQGRDGARFEPRETSAARDEDETP